MLSGLVDVSVLVSACSGSFAAHYKSSARVPAELNEPSFARGTPLLGWCAASPDQASTTEGDAAEISGRPCAGACPTCSPRRD